MNTSLPIPAQYVDTLTWVRALRRLNIKMRSGKPCRQAALCAEWIEKELQRRAEQARHSLEHGRA